MYYAGDELYGDEVTSGPHWLDWDDHLTDREADYDTDDGWDDEVDQAHDAYLDMLAGIAAWHPDTGPHRPRPLPRPLVPTAQDRPVDPLVHRLQDPSRHRLPRQLPAGTGGGRIAESGGRNCIGSIHSEVLVALRERGRQGHPEPDCVFKRGRYSQLCPRRTRRCRRLVGSPLRRCWTPLPDRP